MLSCLLHNGSHLPCRGERHNEPSTNRDTLKEHDRREDPTEHSQSAEAAVPPPPPPALPPPPPILSSPPFDEGAGRRLPFIQREDIICTLHDDAWTGSNTSGGLHGGTVNIRWAFVSMVSSSQCGIRPFSMAKSWRMISGCIYLGLTDLGV